MKKKITIILVLSVSFMWSGCSDFLSEVNKSSQTTENYYTTAEGYEDLVRSCYTPLRNIIQNRDLVFKGTDLFTNLGWNSSTSEDNIGDALNVYDNRLNSEHGSIEKYWEYLYKIVSRANTVVSRQEKVENIDPDVLAVRVAEAKFLRSLSFFYLVQQWGDIPMPLEEIRAVERNQVRIPSSEVYARIISDLEEAEKVLPEKKNTDYGRVTKGAAQFLLARVYLTRGWNFRNALGGTPADFDKAVEYADKVIAAYPLAQTVYDLFPKHSENPLLETFPEQNDRNGEIVFAVQFSENALTNWDDPTTPGERNEGNDYHSVFGGNAEDIPGTLGRTSDYNRHLQLYIVTPAAYRLFDPAIDRRYDLYFVEALYALSDVKGFNYDYAKPDAKIDIAKGDTVVYFAPWNSPVPPQEKGIDVGGRRPYSVLNMDEYGANALTPFHERNKTPMMWKFWEPGIEYSNAKGRFDFALFRSAEAYLIAAEAMLKGGKTGTLGSADVYYNKVLDRALGTARGQEPKCAKHPEALSSLETVSYRATPGNLTMEMLLDERARELLGEYNRWFDLKRTGTLLDRAKKYNPWTGNKNRISDYHYLRPLPQSEIDRTQPAVKNNPGY